MKRVTIQGFTLLEVIIASLLFASLITVLTVTWTLHSRAQIKTMNRRVAADLAELEMERTLGLGYHDAVSATGSFEQIWEVRGQTVTHTYDTEIEVSLYVEPESSGMGKFTQPC